MTNSPANRVCFVAAPLTARSGVYRSSRELVTEARAQGLEWSLVLGVSSKARGAAPVEDEPWISETTMEPTGVGGIRTLSRTLSSLEQVRGSDMIVSLIPQTDMALALGTHRWVAYLRGLPWPEAGESSAAKRRIWKLLETAALQRADAVWATTPLLREHTNLRRTVGLVPAGLDPVPRSWDGAGSRDTVVWAARYDADKNPHLFLDAMRGLPLKGVMYGSGPLEDELRAAAPANVTVAGWVDPARLWDGALAYVGTSNREAFGRSAVEAAMSGVPLVISDQFGAGPLLYTDDAKRADYVLPLGDVGPWRAALMRLAENEQVRVDVSNHLWESGQQLTVSRSVRGIHDALAGLTSR
jgi:glycosyltransferase involved in cell wall biosynthesis